MEIGKSLNEVTDILLGMPKESLSDQKVSLGKVQAYCREFRRFAQNENLATGYINEKLAELEYSAGELAKRRTKNSQPDDFHIRTALGAISRLQINLKNPSNDVS